ncbi:MAG TPA: hypothetical protein VI821_00470 [Candidatus Paceibacterota bacterium]
MIDLFYYFRQFGDNFSDIVANPIVLAIVIICVILLIMILVTDKETQEIQWIRLSIYSFIASIALILLHDNALSQSDDYIKSLEAPSNRLEPVKITPLTQMPMQKIREEIPASPIVTNTNFS